jgi:hypothetical protein
MSAQLAPSPEPVAAPQPRPLRAVPPPPVLPETPRGPDRGIGLLLSFTGALSVMVADVIVVGAVDRSWILIPGFAVLLLMVEIVFAAIMRLLADSGEDTSPDAR